MAWSHNTDSGRSNRSRGSIDSGKRGIRASVVLGSTLLVTLSPLACGGGGDENPPDTSSDPTFTNVTQQVITAGTCGGGQCHSSALVSGFGLAAKATLYGELVNAPASGPKCGPGKTGDAGDGGVFTRVVPGQPDQSLLYLKLSQAAPCGDDMPIGLPLPAAKVDLVKRWILAGAKND